VFWSINRRAGGGLPSLLVMALLSHTVRVGGEHVLLTIWKLVIKSLSPGFIPSSAKKKKVI
jgi:hypothetical protein